MCGVCVCVWGGGVDIPSECFNCIFLSSDSYPIQYIQKLTGDTDCLEQINEYVAILHIQSDIHF